MAWDESLRIYRASMSLKVDGFVLAADEDEARKAALAGQWCFSPVQMPEIDSITAKEEPIERMQEVPHAN